MAVPVRRTAGRGPLEVWEPFGIGPWDSVAEMRTLTERFSRLVNELTRQWPSDGVLPGASAPLGELEVDHGGIEATLAEGVLAVRLPKPAAERRTARKTCPRGCRFGRRPGYIDEAPP